MGNNQLQWPPVDVDWKITYALQRHSAGINLSHLTYLFDIIPANDKALYQWPHVRHVSFKQAIPPRRWPLVRKGLSQDFCNFCMLIYFEYIEAIQSQWKVWKSFEVNGFMKDSISPSASERPSKQCDRSFDRFVLPNWYEHYRKYIKTVVFSLYTSVSTFRCQAII